MADSNQYSSSSEGLKKLEQQITCGICLEHFTNPKVLPCFHSFCLRCLQGVPILLVEGKHSLPCPTCRSPCPVPDNGLATLSPSFVINNLMEVYDLMKKVSDQHASCDNCDNTNADCYCKQCAKFLCPECLNYHDKWKPNTGHQTLTLDEVASTIYQLPSANSKELSATMLCTDHNKKLKVYCETCQQLICRDCMVKKHKNHDYDLVTDTYHRHKDTIVKSSLQPLNEQFQQLVEAKRVLENSKNQILKQAEATKGEIHHTIAKIKNRLDETERKLMEEVDLTSKHKVSVLDHQLKEVDTASGQVTECRDHVEQCVKVGSPQQVLLTKPQIISHTQSVITSVKEKTFTPLEQPDIQLVKSDTIDQIHNNIGKVQYTTLASSVEVEISCQHIPLTKQESTVTISLSLPDGSSVSVSPSNINCRLSPLDNNPPIHCSVKESAQLGQYNVVFTPLTRGLHQLHVTVNESDILGSPLSVPVRALFLHR